MNETLERRFVIRAAADPKARLHDIQGLAALANRSERTIRTWMLRPDFPKSLDIDGHPLWRESSFIKWLDTLV